MGRYITDAKSILVFYQFVLSSALGASSYLAKLQCLFRNFIKVLYLAYLMKK